MIENNPTNVSSAFEILLEEVEAEINFTNRAGAKAFESRDYDKAKEVLERVAAITLFRDRLASMRSEWETMNEGQQEDEETRVERRNLGRLRRGIRTPEAAFRIPILQALVEMGGSGHIGDVLQRVEEKMRKTLKEVDDEPLASTPDLLRWQNTAQWCRNSLVREGLMKSDSARGTWEISEAGWRHLNSKVDERRE